MGDKSDNYIRFSKQAAKFAKDVSVQAGKLVQDAGGKTQEFAGAAVKAVSDSTEKAKQKIVSEIDQNGNGEVDIEDIIIIGLKTPGVRIDRNKFLMSEFQTIYPKEIVLKAIQSTPEKAGIEKTDIDKVANAVIARERNGVSGISAALGMPGGIAMTATIPADIAQYYGFMLRAAQKLMYLYGFPAINVEDNEGVFDSETINTLILCLGIMYGVAGATNAIKAMAKAFASGVEKKLLRAALTKGTIYPIVKSVAKWFSVNMTKEVFAGFFKQSIPVVGGIVGGGLTFVTFGPCCKRLKKSLLDTELSNAKHCATKEENEIFDAIVEEH
ncbi:MAG: hypothetical protein LKE61_04150 [Erysipelotrichaceae bacterium]|jgi:hypothetical protein|nr:hypothetical protein [Erysipelotrichaceae bacterium]MCI1326620.1 hypothetical protein [Solobacterium sp.]MCH4044956.1 hypothetical protein [Erysipelotrichaceae bacterium]MCH4122168.1 hypothetical protein [Erysipelotrichaceae bacterium]MCI1385243.1 hypothetical protein [Solobacterium sp.]